MDATRPHPFVNIGSGNGWVPLDNKPIREPMLTKIYDAKWRNYATIIGIVAE